MDHLCEYRVIKSFAGVSRSVVNSNSGVVLAAAPISATTINRSTRVCQDPYHRQRRSPIRTLARCR